MDLTDRRTRKWGRRPRSRGEGFQELAPRPNGQCAIRILPGGYFVTTVPHFMMMTLLGSCVSACLRDPITGFSGMNHFMLPVNPFSRLTQNSDALRFGNHAMEVLVNELLASGAPRERLEAKVFGGADMGLSNDDATNIGLDNAEFVMQYLQREDIKILSKDLGGKQPRKVHFYPTTGKVKMRLLDRPDVKSIITEEKSFRDKIRNNPPRPIVDDDDVELF